jgi:hypothetical protein
MRNRFDPGGKNANATKGKAPTRRSAAAAKSNAAAKNQAPVALRLTIDVDPLLNDAGDIPLQQQVGNQRRVLKSAVLKWHRQEQGRRQRALTQLGTDLDNELFSF